MASRSPTGRSVVEVSYGPSHPMVVERERDLQGGV
jgi:hypothetical protein